jgi:hypothetical protein
VVAVVVVAEAITQVDSLTPTIQEMPELQLVDMVKAKDQVMALVVAVAVADNWVVPVVQLLMAITEPDLVKMATV